MHFIGYELWAAAGPKLSKRVGKMIIIGTVFVGGSFIKLHVPLASSVLAGPQVYVWVNWCVEWPKSTLPSVGDFPQKLPENTPDLSVPHLFGNKLAGKARNINGNGLDDRRWTRPLVPYIGSIGISASTRSHQPSSDSPLFCAHQAYW